MLRIKDPLDLIAGDPELKARVDFFHKVVRPICLILIVGPVVLLVVVALYEIFKHG